jgi:hypothetical protein
LRKKCGAQLRAELRLAGLVAIDEGGAELACPAVDVIEELLARGGLADLVGDHESGADTKNEQKDVLHFSSRNDCGWYAKPIGATW